MAYQSIWTFTNLPKKVVDILDEDIKAIVNNSLK